MNKPRISVTLKRPSGQSSTTMSYSWSDFVTHQLTYLNALVFKSEGRHEISITAFDWRFCLSETLEL
jgi:hypothetical protein